jgi:RNA polymerase sigma factor (TIGR02999 family)
MTRAERPIILLLMEEVPPLLEALARDAVSGGDLLPLVYDELRRLAARKLAGEKAGHTLQPTALVHEAYLRLLGPEGARVGWNGRAHFFAAAAEAMRRILIENARRKHAEKRGGGRIRIDLIDASAISVETPPDDLIALDDALARLEREDKPKADLVKLHFFVGLTLEEAADLLGLSRATAYRHWTYARAWLHHAIAGNSESPPM